MTKKNKIKRNKAINAFKQLTQTLPVDIICNTLTYFNSSLLNTEIGKMSVEYKVYHKYYNMLKAVANYKTINYYNSDNIYIVRRHGYESFSIKNTGDFILGIVKYGDLINHNTVVDTIDGDKIVAGPCGHLCLMQPLEYERDICSSCSENPYCMLVKSGRF